MLKQVKSSKNKTKLAVLAAMAPLIFGFIAIYITRSSIQTYFTLLLGLFVLQLYLLKKLNYDFRQSYPYLLITSSGVGIAGSFILTIEKIELLKDPSHIASCSLSPVVACSPIINSAPASAFVVPNPVVGALFYGCLLAAGMTLVAMNYGNKGEISLPRWWWLTLLTGTIFGFIFNVYLIWVSLYQVKALCLYCISIWIITIPTFIITLKTVVNNKALKIRNKIIDSLARKTSRYPVEVIVSVYTLVALLILNKFWDYWVSLI